MNEDELHQLRVGWVAARNSHDPAEIDRLMRIYPDQGVVWGDSGFYLDRSCGILGFDYGDAEAGYFLIRYWNPVRRGFVQGFPLEM